MYEEKFTAWMGPNGEVISQMCNECRDYVRTVDHDDHWREHHITTWEMVEEMRRGDVEIDIYPCGEWRLGGEMKYQLCVYDENIPDAGKTFETNDPEAMIRKIYRAWRERKGK